MTSPIPRLIILTNPQCHGFLYDLFVRATQNGLIAPDELSVAGMTWSQIKHPLPEPTAPPMEPPAEERPAQPE